jgi:hypothetical protein
MQTNNIRGNGALDLWSGTLNIATDKFAGQTIVLQNNPGTNHTINLVGARTLNAGFYVNIGNGPWTLNQSTADESTYGGSIGDYASTFVASAVDGGRLNLTGDVSGYSFGTFLTKTGAGTVVLGNPNGNGFNTQQAPNNNGVMADVQQGTLLINNSQGYAMGNRSGTVNVEKGATFGGTGTLSPNQQVVSEDAGSIIAPGDAGQANLGIHPSIGLLTLAGSLTAENGLTMDFKLTGGLHGEPDANGNPTPAPGIDNDAINVNNLTLNGPVTVNFTALNALATETPYTLIFGSGTWTSSDLTFDFIAPAGYAMDLDYGFLKGTPGYVFSRTPGVSSLTVEFVAIPEPSTYGLLGLGLLALVAIGRLRQSRAN